MDFRGGLMGGVLVDVINGGGGRKVTREGGLGELGG